MLLNKVVVSLLLVVCSVNASLNEDHPEEDHSGEDHSKYNCGNGSSVPFSWLCDNVNDCSNGKDEQGCNYLHKCRDGEFMCRSTECIPADQKCDKKDDCLDGSDEIECEQMKKSEEKKAHSGLKHMAISATHTQNATSVPTTKATSRPVFRNQVQCSNQSATLYFINNDSDLLRLHIVNNIPQSSQVFLKDPAIESNVIVSLAFNQDLDEMLFTSKRGPNRIQTVDNASNVRLFASRNIRFDRIAIDLVTKNIYYAGNGIGVGVCDKEAVKCVTLVDAESLNVRYKALVLNPKLGQMIWIQEDFAPVLKIASMDGKKARSLSSFEHVHAISLDAENGMLYIAEEELIVRLDLTAFSREDFAAIRASALAYFNCDLYYVQRTHQTLQVYTDTGEIKEIAALTGDSFPFAIVLDDVKVKQFNPCQFNECQGVCVLAEGMSKPVAECVCESCVVEEVVKESNLSVIWILLLVQLAVILIFLASFAIVYFRVWSALSNKIDEYRGLKQNDANISIGVNNTSLE